VKALDIRTSPASESRVTIFETELTLDPGRSGGRRLISPGRVWATRRLIPFGVGMGPEEPATTTHVMAKKNRSRGR